MSGADPNLDAWAARIRDAVDVLAGELDWALLPVHSITATGECTCGRAACPSPGKHPAIAGWEQAATNNPAHLRRWFGDGALRNIGIHAGLSGIGIVDIDGPEGMATYRRIMGKSMREWTPLVVQSGRAVHGYHLYFDHAAGDIPYRQLDGIELRVGNHQTIAPPSRHADGREYAPFRGDFAKDGRDLPPLPPLLVEWALGGGAGSSTATVPLAGALQPASRVNVAKVKEGGRHDYLMRWGASLVNKGATGDRLLGHLRYVNTSDCDPPMADDEVRALADDLTTRYTPTHDIRAEVEWSEPSPLDAGMTHTAGFPVDALPAWLATYCRAFAEATQTPVDAIAVLALGAFATVIQGRVHVAPAPEWDREETCLFVFLVMESGTRKSATFRAAFAPILQAERELRADLAPQLQDAQRRLDVAKERRDVARKAAKGGATSDERYRLEQDYIKADDGVRAAERAVAECTPPLFHADDVTPEAFIDLLATHGRMTIASAEGGWFGTFAGRYSDGRGNFDPLLKGYSGDGIRVHRKGRDMVDIPNAVCSIVAAVQPDVLREIANTPGATERGLVARILKAAPPTRRGYRNVTDPTPMPGAIRDEYNARVAVVLHELRHVDPVTLHLDAAAHAAFTAHRVAHEHASRPGGRVHELGAWAEKYLGQVARIAAALHFAEHATDGAEQPISAATIEAAIRIGDYFVEQELALVRFAHQSHEAQAARRILDWIITERRSTFTTRDVHAAKRGTTGLHDARSVRQALAVLVDHGYIRPGVTAGGVPGRPSETWDVNPSTHAQNPQNPTGAGFVDFVDASDERGAA